MAVTGCASDNYPVVDVQNDSGEPVRVVMRYSGGDVVVTENLPPGLSYPHSEMGTCDDATLIAFDLDGTEIARKEGPICRPSTWVIPPSSAPAPS